MDKKRYDLEYRKKNYTQIKIEIDKEKTAYYKEYAKQKNISMPKLITMCIDEHIDREKTINE